MLCALWWTAQRLEPSGRRRCWRQWRVSATPVRRVLLPVAIVTAGTGVAVGVLWSLTWPLLTGIGLLLSVVLLAGERVQAFIEEEDGRRRNEMRHWEVRKPAEQRLAHQAAMQRQELDRVQALSLRRLMDPHFLFNALNGIMHDMMTREWDRALRHLKAFNRLAERQIEAGHLGWWTLKEEWESLQDYVELEIRRLGRPIHWELMPLTEGFASLRIPALLVQPIVENALWHGLGGTSRDGPGSLHIGMARVDADRVLITVRNSPSNQGEAEPDPVRPEGDGEGSRRRHASDLIRQRLKLLDRTGRSGYSIESDATCTVARLVMPCSELG